MYLSYLYQNELLDFLLIFLLYLAFQSFLFCCTPQNIHQVIGMNMMARGDQQEIRRIGRGWNTGDIRGGYGTGLWKDIRKDWHTLSQNAVFSLGDGKRLRFWKDIWCGEVALSNAFPNLFNKAVYKEAMVADVWDFSRVEGGWSPVFVRNFND